MRKLLSLFIFLGLSIVFLFSFNSKTFADNFCGLCPTGSDRAGQLPIYGSQPGQACQQLVAGDPNRIYCNADCTVTVATVPTCTGITINQFPGNAFYEGNANYTATGTFSDTVSSTPYATVDYGDGAGVQPLTLNGNTFDLSHTYLGTGSFTVKVTVADGVGTPQSQTAAIYINNVAPTVNSVTVNNPMNSVNSSVTATVAFSDPGTSDTYTLVWDWGDGATSQTTATETGNGTGTASTNHSYTTAGVYTVNVKVVDKDNAFGTGTYQFVTVYDPNGSFLTASGTFTSPQGAIVNNPSATGDMKFGVNAKYVAGNSTPNGKIKLDFRGGDFSFNTTSYNWLVIQNNVAYLSGAGTINGSGNYNILLTGFDGNQTNTSDAIRVQITDPSTNTVVYDNEPGSPTYSYPLTPVTKGSVKIH